MLYAWGLAFATLAIVAIVVKAQWETRQMSYKEIAHYEGTYEHEEGLDDCQVYMKRWIYIGSNTAATVFSWCTMFASKWSMHSALLAYGAASDPNSTLQRITLALFISFGSFIMVFFLDKFEDMDFTGAVADLCIKCMINAIAILVGFSWEQAFDA